MNQVQSQYSLPKITLFSAIPITTFLFLACQILKPRVQNPAWLTSANAGDATLLWSSTSEKIMWQRQENKLGNLHLVKHIKTEMKGNDQVCSFSLDKKHFLVPSLKLNTWSKLIFYCALCNRRFLQLTGVILLFTGLFVEEKKLDPHILKQ